MTTLDFEHPTIAKHLDFAVDHYDREFSTPQLLKALKSRGLDAETAQMVIRKVKSLRRGPARKAALVKFVIGIGLVAVTALLLLLTDRLFWYIGVAGIFSALMGLGQFVFGVGDRD